MKRGKGYCSHLIEGQGEELIINEYGLKRRNKDPGPIKD